MEKLETVDFGALGKDRFDAAIMQTHVIDGMFLRYTSGLEDTIKFILTLTNLISRKTTVLFSLCSLIIKGF